VAVVYLLDESGEWLVPVRAQGALLMSLSRASASGEGWLARSLHDTETLVHSGAGEHVTGELPGLDYADAVCSRPR